MKKSYFTGIYVVAVCVDVPVVSEEYQLRDTCGGGNRIAHSTVTTVLQSSPTSPKQRFCSGPYHAVTEQIMEGDFDGVEKVGEPLPESLSSVLRLRRPTLKCLNRPIASG